MSFYSYYLQVIAKAKETKFIGIVIRIKYYIIQYHMYTTSLSFSGLPLTAWQGLSSNLYAFNSLVARQKT